MTELKEWYQLKKELLGNAAFTLIDKNDKRWERFEYLNNKIMKQLFGKRGDNMKTITIVGKGWFDKVNGNSYHSADVYVDDKHYKIPFQYGYGDQYIYSAFQTLTDNGVIKFDMQKDVPWKYCRDNGITLHAQIIPVARKKDCK